MAVNDLITFRKGTASAWTSANPVLASGEPGYDLTNEILKIGDGVSSWSGLSPVGVGLNNLVEDLSPQLGGDLDLNSYNIINSGNININGNITCDYVYSDLSGTIISANSGNFLNSLKLNGTNVSVSGHTHTSSNITDFNSSVSGLLPVKDITAGYDISITNTSGTYSIASTNLVHVDSQQPQGFVNRTDSRISVSGNIFRIEPTGSSYSYYNQGIKVVKTSGDSLTIPNLTQINYIHFDTSNNQLSNKTTGFDFSTDIPISYIAWNSGVGPSGQMTFFAEERHGIVMDTSTHKWIHYTFGAQYVNGLSISNYSTSGNGSSNSDATIAIGNGTLYQEDIEINITDSSSTDPFCQELSPIAQIPVYYHQGTTGQWVKNTATDYPVKYGANGPQYNLLSGGTWTIPDVSPGGAKRYFAVWILATNQIDDPIISIMGQRVDSNPGSAESNNSWSDVNLTNLPLSEVKPLYRLIFAGDSDFTNTPKCYLYSILDIRVSVVSTIAGVSQNDHGSLFGLGDDDHSQYLHTDNNRTVNATHNFVNGLTSNGLINSTSGNFTNLTVNNTGVSISGHSHTSSSITDFNSSVSGLLTVKDIIAGTGVTITSSNGSYTINATGGSGGSSSNVGVRGVISTTGNLSSFAVSGGYPVGYLDLFQDGVKLVSDLDFAATDGSNVTLSNSVPSGTVLEYLTMASGVSSGGGALSGSVTIPQLGDYAFSSVSLLLHMNGSGNTFTDSSATPKAIIAFGNATQNTEQSKFGGRAAYFDGTGDYIQLSTQNQSSLQFSTQQHTVEFWFKTAITQQYTCLFYRGQQSEAAYDYVLNINNASASAGDLALYSLGFGGAMTTTSGGWNDNVWHHVAIVRDAGNVFRMYVDGVQQATRTYDMTQSYSNSSDSIIRIGKDGALSGRDYSGYIDELRISTVCRYPSGTSFVPSAIAFSDAAEATFPVTITGSSGSSSGLSWSSVPASATATGTAGQIAYDEGFQYTCVATNTWKRMPLSGWSNDPFASSVAILLHMDGTGNSFVDSSSTPKTITASGSATQSTAQSKFGGKSGYFAGDGGYIISQASSDFNLGSENWVIEAWVYFNNVDAHQRLAGGDAQFSDPFLNWAWYTTTSGSLDYYLSSNGFSWNLASARSFGSISPNQWYHVALVRNGSTVTPYVNGTAGQTTDVSSSSIFHNTNNGPFIGAQVYSNSNFNGYIDEFRMTVGTNRLYIGSSIPVPTEAFPNP